MKKPIIALAAVLLSFPSISSGQPDTTWQKWQWLIGEWVGEGSGNPGQGSGVFSLQPDLDRKILIRKNHYEYSATGETARRIHDDLMIVYREGAGEPRKAIYFDNEGHTILYAITYHPGSIVLTSDKVPNMPVFRLSYAAPENDTIRVKFEMSRDGETFVTYTEGKCTKKK